jgi:MerR family transcriptional regulator, copper efflux regulator
LGLLKISDVATRVGVLPSTIRYYTKLGLIQPSGKTQGGFSLFDEAAVVRAAEIRRLQHDERLTLEEIAERLRHPARRHKSRGTRT